MHSVSFWGSVNSALWLAAPIGAWAVARGSQPAVSAVDGWRARDIAGRIAALLASGGAIREAETWRRRA